MRQKHATGARMRPYHEGHQFALTEWVRGEKEEASDSWLRRRGWVLWDGMYKGRRRCKGCTTEGETGGGLVGEREGWV